MRTYLGVCTAAFRAWLTFGARLAWGGSLAFSAMACGSSPPAPQTAHVDNARALPTPTAQVNVAAPTKVEPSCEQAVAQSHARRLQICAGECESMDAANGSAERRGDSCVAAASALAQHSPKDHAAITRALERACDLGHEEGCYRLSLTFDQRDDATKTAAKGCHEEGRTPYALKNCLMVAEARAASGTPSDLQAAMPEFERLCNQGERRACELKINNARAIEKANAPLPLEGTLVSRTASVVRIKLARDAHVPVGAVAELQRAFEGKPGDKSPLGVFGAIFGGRISGWISIATVSVGKVQGDIVELSVKSERSNVVMNGKKVNHFTPGAKVKLLVPRSAETTASTR